MSVKNYSIKSLKEKLKSESDAGKKKQLRLLLDEMAEVYPDESEIPNDPKTLFTQPAKWKSKEIKKKLVMGVLGESFSGKTFTTLSASHLTEKHIMNDFKNIQIKQKKKFIEFLSEYIPFTPVWVIGTEKSTHECLTSMDNEEYFEHANINYVEVLERGDGLTLVDHFKTYKNFLIALYSLTNLKQGTVILDSMSGILAAQHEVVRRIIMKVPSLKKEQGVMPRHWFWRNVEQEGIMFYGRMLPVNFLFTVKIIKQHNESGNDIEKVKWHEETNRHLSSVIIKNERIGEKANFRSTIQKCRPNKELYHKVFNNLSLPMFMYNLFLSKK